MREDKKKAHLKVFGWQKVQVTMDDFENNTDCLWG